MTLGREKLLNIGGLGVKERCLKDDIGDESTVSSSTLSQAPTPTQSLPSAHPGAAVLVSSAVCLWIDRFVTLKIELPLGMGHSVT